MKKTFLAILLFFAISFAAKSQLKYTVKLDAGYQNFLSRNFEVEPGPNWKGYYLGENLGAIDVSLANGVSFKENLRLGVGIGYLNYNRNIKGYSLFGDLEYAFGSKNIKPLINLKIGTSYITNDYKQEKNSFGLVDIAVGAETKLGRKFSGQLKVGLNFAGASCQFLPIRLGLRF